MLPQISDPTFKVSAALYFLDGHYLFKSWNGNGPSSKFVTAADVAAAFSQREQDTGWLPAGIVRTGVNVRGTWFVYSAPAQKVTILIEGHDQPVTVPIPRTVLAGVGTSYGLWALHSKRFDPAEEAFRAPFPNVSAENGAICWGSNVPGEANPGQARKVWELFFSSPFNNHWANGKSKVVKNFVGELLLRLSEKNARAYPVDDLVPAGGDIGHVVTRFIGA